LHAVAAARVRARPADAADRRRPPAGPRHPHGPARPHQLGRRRPGVLPHDTRTDREGGPVHRGEVRGEGRRRDGLRRPAPPLTPGEPLDNADDGDIDFLVGRLKEKIAAGLERYRADYAAYYEACKRPGSPPMRDPNPTVILIPGVGIVAWGKDKSESRVTAEFYGCAVEVMRGAAAVSRYVALPR